ncbi:MAG: hypothetical protein ACRDKJ_01470 [Actinomycetota bacterium]
MRVSRLLVAALLGAAAIGAVFRSANASTVGQVGGWLAAAALAAVAVGVARERRWAYGSAFFLGLFWLWAAVALRIQGVMGAPEIFAWLIWSVAVIVGSVRVRSGT